MATTLKRRKGKKRKFKKLTFKVSVKQKLAIDKYCRVNKITPNKLIKVLIKNHLGKCPNLFENDNHHISENQLKLFDTEDK